MDGILLKEAALKLSPFERAQLIDALWQSLDPSDQTAIDQAWLEESQDRLQAYHQGEIETVDGEPLDHRFGREEGSAGHHRGGIYPMEGAEVAVAEAAVGGEGSL